MRPITDSRWGLGNAMRVRAVSGECIPKPNFPIIISYWGTDDFLPGFQWEIIS